MSKTDLVDEIRDLIYRVSVAKLERVPSVGDAAKAHYERGVSDGVDELAELITALLDEHKKTNT